MRVALAHDFLIRWGGAEEVLFALHRLFPEATIYTLFYDQQLINHYFSDVEIRGSSLQKIYRGIKGIQGIIGIKGGDVHQWLLPWMPVAVEELDFSDYDLVISSSSAFMKGIVVPSKTKHICYLHTPTRWAWQDYHRLAAMALKNADSPSPPPSLKLRRAKRLRWAGIKIKILLRAISGLSLVAFFKRLYIHFFRLWDFEAAQRPDMFIANSKYTAQRIYKYYGRESRVIYPSIKIPNFPPLLKLRRASKFQIKNSPATIFAPQNLGGSNSKYQNVDIFNNQYFIVVSRLSDYKRIDLVIEAFCNLPYQLVVVGEGPAERKLKTKNKKQKIKVIFLKFIKDKNELYQLIKNSIALIHPTEEDFGMAMAEAIALGKPVIAYQYGGGREIISPGKTGELFDKQSVESLREAVLRLINRRVKYKQSYFQQKAMEFSYKKFKGKLFSLIDYSLKIS